MVLPVLPLGPFVRACSVKTFSATSISCRQPAQTDKLDAGSSLADSFDGETDADVFLQCLAEGDTLQIAR